MLVAPADSEQPPVILTGATDLLLVERSEARLGIVCATDAAASKGVKVIGTFPVEGHPAATYPFAISRHAADNKEAGDFFAFATGNEATETYRRFGFGLRPQ